MVKPKNNAFEHSGIILADEETCKNHCYFGNAFFRDFAGDLP